MWMVVDRPSNSLRLEVYRLLKRPRHVYVCLYWLKICVYVYEHLKVYPKI